MRKGQSSQLMSIFVPMLVVCVMAVAFGLVVSDLGQNYGVSYDDTSYQTIVNQTSSINAVKQGAADGMLGTDEDRSNVLTSSERLITGAYNSILVLGDIPSIYSTMITVVAESIGVPDTIFNLILAGIMFAIVAVVIFLALGRV
jgi:hypothetical protein